MSVFSKLSKRLASAPQDEANAQVAVSEPEPKEPSDTLTEEEIVRVYDEEGYDQFGYDKEGYRRSGYDKNGYRKDIGEPLNPSVAVTEDIKKYRKANGYYEYEMAIFANYRDLKDNFEGNGEDVSEILYDVYVNDEKRAVELWKWLLTTFYITLGTPADAYRLGSAVLYTFQKRNVEMAKILALLKDNPVIAGAVFQFSAFIDARQADVLRAALLAGDFELYDKLMTHLLQNKNLGKEGALPIDKILKLIIDGIPGTEMNDEIYQAISKYNKRAKMMMRKVLQQMLEDNMKYYREQKALKKAEEERNAKLEEQRRRLAEELTQQQKEAGSRLTQRQVRAKFSELKAASIANRKVHPTWEGGEFADFQQLEGLMTPDKGKQNILDTLLPDDKLELFREPFNKHDSMAIAVRDEQGNKIGYISNHANTMLALLMDHGQKMFGRIFSIGREPDSDIVQVCIEIFMEDD